MNLVCDPVLASLAPVCIVLSAVDLDNDLLSTCAKVAIVVAVLSVNLEGYEDSAVDLLVLISEKNGVDIMGLIAITVLDHVSMLESKCGKLHGKSYATGVTSGVDLAKVSSYSVSSVLGNGVTGSGNNLSSDLKSLTVDGVGVNLLTVSGTSSSSYYRLAAISDSDGLGLGTLSEGSAAISTNSLKSVGAVVGGSNCPVAPSVTLRIGAGLNVNVLNAVAVLTLSNSTTYPSAGVGVGLGLHRIVLAPNVALSAVCARLKLNAASGTADDPSVGPLTLTDTSLVLCILLLASYVTESINEISLNVLLCAASTLVKSVTALGTGGSYGRSNDGVLVAYDSPGCVAAIYTNAKLNALRGHGVLTARPYFILECVILAIGKILTLGANAKILIANPPVAVSTDVGSKTSNALLALLALNACGALKTLVALIALLACATSNESCTNHEDHHYNCKQFNNVLVHSKISP
jgi:hypothetical protein